MDERKLWHTLQARCVWQVSFADNDTTIARSLFVFNATVINDVVPVILCFIISYYLFIKFYSAANQR